MSPSSSAQVVEAVDRTYTLDIPRGSVAAVHASDLDLVLVLRDGTQVVLVQAALGAMGSRPPTVSFTGGGTVPASDLLATIGKVEKLRYAAQTVATMEGPAPDGGGKPQGRSAVARSADEGPGDVPARGAGSVPDAPRSDVEAQAAKIAGSVAAPPVETPPAVPAKAPTPFDAPPLRTGGPPAGKSTVLVKTETIVERIVEVGPPPLPLPVEPALDLRLLNVVGQKTDPIVGAGLQIRGGGGAPPSDTDADPAAQVARESIRGSERADVIEGDSAAASEGSFAKVLALSLTDATVFRSVVLSGLPADITVGRASKLPDGSWKLAVSGGASAGTLNLVLTYPVEDDAPARRFTLSIDVEYADEDGRRGTVQRDIDVLVQRVAGPDDLPSIDPATGVPVLVLPLNAVGDEIRARGGNDVVRGQVGDDLIFGEGGDDRLFGGQGEDTLHGGMGADLLDGGTGRDTASFADLEAGVTVDLASGEATDADGDVDRLVSIEAVEGSDFDDLLLGGARDDLLSGGAGNDRVAGRDGADVMSGGDGVDTLDYTGSEEAVRVNLQAGAASGGHAQGDAFDGFENVAGSAFDDLLVGDRGVNRLEGGDGDDTLVGGVGADRLDGGLGVDIADYSGSRAGVTVDLTLARQATQAGDASGDALSGIESLLGSAFDDALTGDAGDNLLAGGAGGDRLEAGAGRDTIDGGDGEDTVSYAGSGAGVRVDLRSADPQAGGDADGDLLSNVEHVTGSRSADAIVGDERGNRLDGGAGDDVLAGLAGADTLLGGDGIDTASYADSAEAVSVNLGSAGPQRGGHAEGDRLAGIERLVGSGSDDTLGGDDGANRLDGGAGRDALAGAAGDDELLGGDGDDVLAGGAGADRLAGGAGWDVATYAGATAGVTVSLTAGAVGAGDALGDTFDSIEAWVGSGSDDAFTMGAAAHAIDGGDGADTADYSRASGAVTVDLRLEVQGADAGWAAGDRLVRIENVVGAAGNDLLVGDAAANRLTGGAGVDTLVGGDGDDTLVGGAGADVLRGGEGRDVASYETSTAGMTIHLVTPASSTGDARGDTWESIEAWVGGSGADTFVMSDAATDVDGGLGGDTASYAAADGVRVDLRLAVQASDGGWAAGDRLVRIEHLTGSGGADRLVGDTAANRIDGGAGNDTLFGAGGVDTLVGGAGTDTVDFSEASNVVNIDARSTSGSWSVTYLDSTTWATLGSGGTLSGIERIVGSIWGDRVIMGSGVVTFDGGMGPDWVDYQFADAPVVVDLSLNGLAQAAGSGWASGDVLVDVEGARGSRWADTLLGTALDNRFWGGDGNDTVLADGGDDQAWGENGDDRIELGSGNDHGSGGDGADVIVGGEGADTLFGGDGHDVLEGGAANDGLDGGDGDDLLLGGDGSDSMNGREGNDTLRGGAGNDTLVADVSGRDELDGGDGYDSLMLDAGGVSVAGRDYVVHVDGRTASSGGALEGDLFANFERIVGGAGNEHVVVSSGIDRVNLQGGFDTLDFSLITGPLTVDLSNNVARFGTPRATVNVFDIERVIGTSGGDALTGAASGEVLVGNGGADRLVGLGGDDVFEVLAQQALGVGRVLDRVDGGAGTDTIRLTGMTEGQLVDVADLVGRNATAQQVATSVEVLDLRDGAGQSVMLSVADLLALTEPAPGSPATPTLTLRLDAGDTVSLSVDAGRTAVADANGAGVTVYAGDPTGGAVLARLDYAIA